MRENLICWAYVLLILSLLTPARFNFFLHFILSPFLFQVIVFKDRHGGRADYENGC